MFDWQVRTFAIIRTLIPDGAVNWHWQERMNHRVVEYAGFILVYVTKQPRNVIRKYAVAG